MGAIVERERCVVCEYEFPEGTVTSNGLCPRCQGMVNSADIMRVVTSVSWRWARRHPVEYTETPLRPGASAQHEIIHGQLYTDGKVTERIGLTRRAREGLGVLSASVDRFGLEIQRLRSIAGNEKAVAAAASKYAETKSNVALETKRKINAIARMGWWQRLVFLFRGRRYIDRFVDF